MYKTLNFTIQEAFKVSSVVPQIKSMLREVEKATLIHYTIHMLPAVIYGF